MSLHTRHPEPLYPEPSVWLCRVQGMLLPQSGMEPPRGSNELAQGLGFFWRRIVFRSLGLRGFTCGAQGLGSSCQGAGLWGFTALCELQSQATPWLKSNFHGVHCLTRPNASGLKWRHVRETNYVNVMCDDYKFRDYGHKNKNSSKCPAQMLYRLQASLISGPEHVQYPRGLSTQYSHILTRNLYYTYQTQNPKHHMICHI